MIAFNFNALMFYLFIACYCLFPAWYIPTLSASSMHLLLNVFLIIAALINYFPWTKDAELRLRTGSAREIDYKKYLSPLLAMVSIAAVHFVYFWKLPVFTGEDAQSYLSPPATFTAYLENFINPYLLAGLICSLFILIAAAAWRGRLFNRKVKAAELLVLAAIVNIYGIYLSRSGFIEKLGLWQSLLRFPPLHKFLTTLSFMTLGINAVIPSLTQYLFLAAAVIFIIKSIELAQGHAARTPILISGLLFPTFFSLSNFATIECGTLFFFSVVSYYFLKSFSDEESIIYAVFWLALGVLYRHLALVEIGILYVSLFYLLALKKIDTARAKKYALYFLIPAVAGAPFTALSYLFHVRTTGFVKEGDYDIKPLDTGFLNLLATLGPVITGLLLVSVIYCLLKKKRFAWYWLILTLAYYVVMGRTVASDIVRQSQPFYLGLFYFFSVMISDGVIYLRSKRKVYEVIAVILLIAIFVQKSLFDMNPKSQRITLANRYQDILPYHLALTYIKENGMSDARIYAPMEVEPSKFYIAKNHLTGKIYWDRRLPSYPVTAGAILSYFYKNNFDYLFLPRSNSPTVQATMPVKVVDEILSKKNLKIVKVFDYKDNSCILLEP